MVGFFCVLVCLSCYNVSGSPSSTGLNSGVVDMYSFSML